MASQPTIANVPLTSACYDRKPIAGINSLRQLELCGKLNIRGNADDSNFLNGVKQALELNLPVNANTQNALNAKCLYWLGPDEWLLHCDLDETSKLEDAMHTQLTGLHHAVTEVSDYYTVLRLQGPDAETLLRKACPLDLHHSVFLSGCIAQTRFGHASILLHKLEDGESWDIQVRWTYAEYVWDYLISAMNTL